MGLQVGFSSSTTDGADVAAMHIGVLVDLISATTYGDNVAAGVINTVTSQIANRVGAVSEMSGDSASWLL